MIEAGELGQARVFLEKYVTENPKEELAKYALGYRNGKATGNTTPPASQK